MAETVTIYLKTSAEAQGLTQILQGLGQVKNQATLAGTSLGGMGNAIRRLLGPLTAALSVAALIRYTKHTIENADAMAKSAQKAGMAVDAFSALAFSASMANVSQEELVNSSKGLAQWMEKTGQTGRNLQDVLLEQADVFSKMPDGFEKIRMAQERFGRAGQQLIPLLNQGSEAIREQMREAEIFGAVIGPRFAANAGRFQDNLTRISTLFRGIANVLADTLIPELIKMQESFFNWVKTSNAHHDVIDSLIAGYALLAQAIGGVNMALQATIGYVASFAGATVGGGAGPYEALRIAGEQTKQNIEDITKRLEKIKAMGRNPDPGSAPLTDSDKRESFESKMKSSSLKLSENKLLIDELQTRGLILQTYQGNDVLENRRVGTLKQESTQINELLTQSAKRLEMDRRRIELAMQSKVIEDDDGEAKLLENAQKLFEIYKQIEGIKAATNDFTFFEKLSRGIQDLAEEFDNLGASIADVLINGIKGAIDTVADGIWQVIDGTATWGDLFRQVGRQIISDLIRIAIQELFLDNLKKGIMMTWKALKTAHRAADVVEANTTELSKTPALAMNATLSSIASWGIAVAVGVAAIAAILASVGAFERGGVVGGGQQFIRVNESGTEAVLNAGATARLGPGVINALNAGMFGASDLEARIADNMSMPMTQPSGGMDFERGGASEQPVTVNLLLVDSRNSQAAENFLKSARGRVVMAEVSRDEKIEIGIS